MKVYIAHSRSYDYQTQLYHPVRRQVNLPQDVEIILPHESDYDNRQGRDFYQKLDLIIAEVSYPATGLGIELGWAYDSHVPIACIYHDDAKISGSLKTVTSAFFTYHDTSSLVNLITTLIQERLETQGE